MKLTQLTRSHEWWDYKTTQVLGLAYAAAILGGGSLFNLLSPAFLLIFGSLVIVAVYASVINDFTDYKIDIACGKQNMMQKLSIPLRIGIIFLSLLTVVGVTYFIYPDRLSAVFYWSIVAAISLYSFEPFRLKRRGVLGVISCAMAEHLFPTLFAVSIVFYYSSFDVNYLFAVTCGVISFSYGLRSILWHQFLDRNNDLTSNIKTFANQNDPQSFTLIPRLLVILELIAIIGLLVQIGLWLPSLSFILYLIYAGCKFAFFKTSVVFVISPPNGFFQIIFLEFYIVFFPIACLLYIACTQEYGFIVLLIHILLFHKRLLLIIKECFEILKFIVRKVGGCC